MTKELGLMWQMDAKKGVEGNVVLALKAHEKRFGCAASVCYANPEDLKEEVKMENVAVRAERSCLKGHLFVGRPYNEEKKFWVEFGERRAE